MSGNISQIGKFKRVHNEQHKEAKMDSYLVCDWRNENSEFGTRER